MRSTRRTNAPCHLDDSSQHAAGNGDLGQRSIRILLVDDQVIFRELFRTWLTLNPDIEVVGEAGNVRDALHLAGTLHPTLVLTEICFPGIHGIEGIREMKSMHPWIKIIALTTHLSETSVRAALRAGASGLLEKSASLEEVRSALDNVIKEKTYLCPRAAEIVACGCVANGRSPWEMLTQRECEVLKCVAEGMRNNDVAARLRISVKTVEKHRASLMSKLKLHTVASLTAFAIGEGLIAGNAGLR